MRAIEYGWVIVATGFVIHFFGGGSRFAFGLMLKPMVDDLEWSRTTVSLLVTCFMLVSALAMPLAGRLADRYSLKGILAAGVAAGGAGLALMRNVAAPWHAFALYGVVNGLGNAGASNPTVGVMVTRWFRERTGAAVSIATSGNAVGQLVIIAALATTIESLGWRNAFGALGAASLIVVLPLVLVAVRSPSGGGWTAAVDDEASETGQQGRLDLRGLLTSRDMILLLIVYVTCGFQDFFVVTHVVAFADDVGVGTTLSGNILALMGILGLAGVIASGLMSDAHGPSRPTVICFAIRIAVFGAVLYFQQTPGVLLFALAYGFTFMITAPLTVVFARNTFGTGRLGFVSGLLSMVHQVAGGLGAVFGATVFDRWGDYDRAFMVMAVLAVVGVAATLAVRERPIPTAVALAPSPSTGEGRGEGGRGGNDEGR